jgi:hypothetical protein
MTVSTHFALTILNLASEPFEYVATSLVEAYLTVVVKRVTFSTNHVLDPAELVSVDGLERLILSPISYGRRTNIIRIPSKNVDDADPNMKARLRKNVHIDVSGAQ